MKSKTILGADGATKMRQITVGIHGKGGEAGIKAIQQLAGMVDSLKQCQMHAASDTLKEWLYEWNKYHPDQPLYAIKADIHHYFQSIDHAVLKTEIRKVIKDAGVEEHRTQER